MRLCLVICLNLLARRLRRPNSLRITRSLLRLQTPRVASAKRASLPTCLVYWHGAACGFLQSTWTRKETSRTILDTATEPTMVATSSMCCTAPRRRRPWMASVQVSTCGPEENVWPNQ
jgi:hypothetical protein